MRSLLVLMFVGLTAAPAHAAYESVDALLESCDSSESGANAMYCIGYIAGVADAVENLAACPPSDLWMAKARQVAVDALRDAARNGYGGAPASQAIVEGLATKYPC